MDMASELSPIDISRIPELAQLIDEVTATGKRRRIVRDGRDVAVLAPARASDAARARRFRRVLAIAERNPDGDGDAFLEELERDDAERRTRSEA
jgi:antitoxin (DNA-binding transcriptional repressor) of toxin-antitoxin stability system